MCFASKSPPAPKAPPAPPDQRSADIEGRRQRQVAAQMAAKSGMESTMTSGVGGDQSPAPALKPTLGA